MPVAPGATENDGACAPVGITTADTVPQFGDVTVKVGIVFPQLADDFQGFVHIHELVGIGVCADVILFVAIDVATRIDGVEGFFVEVLVRGENGGVFANGVVDFLDALRQPFL